MKNPPLNLVLAHGGHSEQSWKDAAKIRSELIKKGLILPVLNKV